MSSDPVVTVENVGKCYHIYDKHIDRLKQSLALGRGKRFREFWALRDINFSIERGETMGIIGANGSGKSTLLQIIFGVLNPTVGTLNVNGKVSGLLELGAGFNPEETGRENVMINAAIQGVPKEEIPELFEKIAAFADIGDFLDQPVKVYSSGMSVRLGFALQISIPCDVLIIDEALAVGDELFQRRCYRALEQFRNDGGTILFVSHSAASVKQLCKRAVFLDHGELIQRGRCQVVVENYQKFLYMREPERSQFRAELKNSSVVPDQVYMTPETVSVHDTIAVPILKTAGELDQGTDRNPPPAHYVEGLTTQTATYYQAVGAIISEPRIETIDGEKVNVLNPRERYKYRYRVKFTDDAENVAFGWLIKSTSGVELGGGAHDGGEAFYRNVLKGSVFQICFEFTANLYPGVYFLNCGVSGDVGESHGFMHRVIDAVAFKVRNVYSKLVTGFVDCDYQVQISIEQPKAKVESKENTLA